MCHHYHDQYLSSFIITLKLTKNNNTTKKQYDALYTCMIRNVSFVSETNVLESKDKGVVSPGYKEDSVDYNDGKNWYPKKYLNNNITQTSEPSLNWLKNTNTSIIGPKIS